MSATVNRRALLRGSAAVAVAGAAVVTLPEASASTPRSCSRPEGAAG